MNNLLSRFLLIVMLPLAVGAQDDAKKPDKLTADEIVSRHIASLGDNAVLRSAGSRAMTGKGSLTSKIGTTFLLEGTGQMGSAGHSFVFAIVFDNPTYPYEKVAFDGQNATYGLPSGKQTTLVTYLKAQNAI